MLLLGTYGAGETFFSLKGELEAIMTSLRLPKATYAAVKDNPSYHPGRCASVSINGQLLGYMGQVHPLVAKNYGMEVEKAKEVLRDEDKENIKKDCKIEKAVEFILANAKLGEAKKPAAKKATKAEGEKAPAKKTTKKAADDAEKKPAAKKTTAKKTTAKAEGEKAPAKKTTAAKKTTKKAEEK